MFFSLNGYKSWEDAKLSFHSWGKRQRDMVDSWNKIDLSVKDHPDMVATKDMNEEQELE